MGFAGQIFAARVAVGLAVPSPKAMQAQGGMIAKGIESIYKTTNSVAIQGMKDRAAAADQAAKDAGARVVAAEKAVNASLTTGLAATLKNGETLHEVFGRNLGDTSESIGASFAALEKLDPAIGGAMLKGIDSTMSQAQRAEQMVKNWGDMSDAQHKAAFKRSKTVVTMAEGEVIAIDKQIEAMKETLETGEGLRKYGKKVAKTAAAEQQARINLKEEERAGAVERHALAKQSMGDLKQIDNFVQGSFIPTMAELEDAKKAEAAASKAADKANKDFSDGMAGLKQTATEAAQQVHNAAFTIKAGFTEAVRESVSVLTGFYYELNQATTALIDFEAELLNANSVFNVTRDELFATSNVITQFGQQFGLEMQNGATGLYQLASAGLSADESMQILPETLKLSMAVQGDHNTIAKLTTQTLFGFEMGAERAAEVTDKFAHAIQNSLIEYEDLSSAVKFALPFFTSTGQSIDQLLGSLQVLTNRALEAGIAGRGLRQALAEFAEGAEDNSTAFRQMGIDILEADGSMKQLTEIAADFAQVVGEDTVNNTELLTALIQDLNVRGATAFIHLVQASDEFTQAVHDSENAAGELDTMVQIQNESMKSQIQILKNNVQMMFFMRDASYEGTEFMNAFHEAVVTAVASLSDLVVTQKDGVYVLTAFGQQMQDVSVKGIQLFVELIQQAVVIVRDLTEAGSLNLELLKLYAIPLKLIFDFLTLIGPEGTRFLLYFHMLSKLMPIATLGQTANTIALLNHTAALKASTGAEVVATQSIWARVYAYIAVRVQALYNIVTQGMYQTQQAIGISLTMGEITAEQAWLNSKILSIQAKTVSIFQYIKAIPLALYQIATTGLEANALIAKSGVDTAANQIKANSIILYIHEISLKVRSIATSIYENTIGAIGVFWKEMQAKATAKNIALTSGLTYATAASTAANTIDTISMAVRTMATWALTAAQSALNAVMYANPIMWVVIGVIALIGVLYILQKEFNVIGAIIDFIGGVFNKLGDIVKSVWDDYIYPFVYVMGLEFMALFAVLGYAVKAFFDALVTIKDAMLGIIPHGLLDAIKSILLFPLQFPLAVFQTVFGVVKDYFSALIDTFGILYDLITGKVSVKEAFIQLGEVWMNFFSNMKDRIVELINKVDVLKKAVDSAKGAGEWVIEGAASLNPFATGGYVTGMNGGGAVGGRQPYLVGEQGPEIFMPNNAGQILNNRRTEDIMQKGLQRGAAMGGSGQVAVVDRMVVKNMRSKKSRIGLDRFAGVI